MRYIAQGRGHLSQNILSSGESVTLDFFNSSYNSVKVYPSVLYIANSANDGDVKLSFYDGTVRIVPAKTNYHIAIDSVRSMTLINQGHYDIYTYTLDKAAASESDITFAAAASQNQNDFLYHFDTSAELTTNYGVEPANFGSAVNTGGTLAGTAKFGAGALSLAAVGQRWVITDRQFFTIGKNYVIDFWAQFPVFATAAYNPIMHIRDVSYITSFIDIGVIPSGAIRCSGITPLIDGAVTVTASTSWRFFRIVITATRIIIYLDGVKYLDMAINVFTRVGDLARWDIVTAGINIYIDELRIARGLILDDPTLIPTQPYY